MELSSFDLSNLVPIGSGIAVILGSVRLMVWVIGSMQQVMARNDELATQGFASYKAETETTLQRQRDEMARHQTEITRLEALVREGQATILELQRDRLELIATNRRLEHRIQLLEEAQGIPPTA